MLFSAQVYADALMKNKAMSANTIIEFYVDDNGVRAEFEIGLPEIENFKNLLPDPIYQELNFGDTPMLPRVQTFVSEELYLLNENNIKLVGELIKIGPAKRILRDPINGTPLPIQDEALDVVQATIIYKFPKNTRPEQLIFASPVRGEIGFVVYHQGVAVNDFRFIASGHSLNLDWSDPWYSTFKSKNLKRQYSSPMNGFIYVEPFEVRKEIIARPKDLQRWVDLGLEGKKIITAEMQQQIKQKAGEFLSKHHPVTINGEAVTGILESVNFLERTLTSSQVIDSGESIAVDSAILGAIFVYPQTTLPEKVVMTWDLWDERIINVPVSAVDQAGPLASSLQEDWNELVWENFLKDPIVPTLNTVEAPAPQWQTFINKSLPVLAVLALLALFWLVYVVKNKQNSLVAAASFCFTLIVGALVVNFAKSNEPDQERANAIVADLLHNIYRSFDYREEGDIYDVLELSVTGELLTDIFLETKHSLVLANQGGAQAKVKAVVLENIELKPSEQDNSFQVEADWIVHGAVGHWGHIHQRSNHYQAVLTLVVDGQHWKLQQMMVLQQERL